MLARGKSYQPVPAIVRTSWPSPLQTQGTKLLFRARSFSCASSRTKDGEKKPWIICERNAIHHVLCMMDVFWIILFQGLKQTSKLPFPPHPYLNNKALNSRLKGPVFKLHRPKVRLPVSHRWLKHFLNYFFRERMRLIYTGENSLSLWTAPDLSWLM